MDDKQFDKLLQRINEGAVAAIGKVYTPAVIEARLKKIHRGGRGPA